MLGACWEDVALKKAAIDGMSPLKQGLALLCSSSKYGSLSFCSFPIPLSLGPGLASIPEERVVLGRLCVLGEVEEAPSDMIVKDCSGTVSLPGSSGAVCEQGSPTPKKKTPSLK